MLYYLAEASDDLITFKRFLFFTLVLLPPVLALVDLPILRAYGFVYGMGFSGIDMAFVGALPYFTGRYLKRKLNFDVSPILLTQSLLLFFTAVIAYIYGMVVVWVALLIGTLSMLVAPVKTAFEEYDKMFGKNARRFKCSVFFFILLSMGVSLPVIWGAFPKQLTESFGLVDVVLHYLGLFSTLYIFPLINEKLS
ncbi:hypothetical protein [Palaeococcus pacificus]|nr:hypothetical protein [Palaeococcus pacificus]